MLNETTDGVKEIFTKSRTLKTTGKIFYQNKKWDIFFYLNAHFAQISQIFFQFFDNVSWKKGTFAKSLPTI